MKLIEKLQQQVREMFAEKMSAIHPEARVALEKTRVDLVRLPGRIEISINSNGDPEVEKVKELFLDSMLTPLSGMIALLGCQLNVEMAQEPSRNGEPAVEGKANADGEKPPRPGKLSPETREFLSLPPHIQRQVLDYAKRWINANFERSDEDKTGKGAS